MSLGFRKSPGLQSSIHKGACEPMQMYGKWASTYIGLNHWRSPIRMVRPERNKIGSLYFHISYEHGNCDMETPKESDANECREIDPPTNVRHINFTSDAECSQHTFISRSTSAICQSPSACNVVGHPDRPRCERSPRSRINRSAASRLSPLERSIESTRCLLSQMNTTSLIQMRGQKAIVRGLWGAFGLTNPLSQVRRVHLQNGKTVRTRFRLQSHQWGTTVLEHGLSPQVTLITR